MNKKGFTLVEIIAMVVVIGILMAITIPNISGIIKKNRESQAIEDVNKMVGNAKAKIDSGKIEAPRLNTCIVFALKSIDTNDDINTGLNGGTYDPYKSFVVVARKPLEGEYETSATSEYKYYLHLHEVKEEGGGSQAFSTRGATGEIALIDYDDFVKKPEDYFPKKGRYNDYVDIEYYGKNGCTSCIDGDINYLWKYGKAETYEEAEAITGKLCEEILAIYIK